MLHYITQILPLFPAQISPTFPLLQLSLFSLSGYFPFSLWLCCSRCLAGTPYQLSSTPASQPSLMYFLCFELNLFIYHVRPLPFAYSVYLPSNKQLKFQFSSLQLNLFFFFSWELIICLACFRTLGVLHWVSQFQPLGAHNWLGESSTQTNHTLTVGEVLSQRLAKRAMAVQSWWGGDCPAWLMGCG